MFSINHYCLIVTDLERSIAFYRDVMGMSLRSRVTRGEDIAAAIARPGTTMHNAILYFAHSPHPALELIQYQPAGVKVDLQIPNPGTSHIAFGVADIHAAVAQPACPRRGGGCRPRAPGTQPRHRCARRYHRLLQRPGRHLPGAVPGSGSAGPAGLGEGTAQPIRRPRIASRHMGEGGLDTVSIK